MVMHGFDLGQGKRVVERMTWLKDILYLFCFGYVISVLASHLFNPFTIKRAVVFPFLSLYMFVHYVTNQSISLQSKYHNILNYASCLINSVKLSNLFSSK